MTKIAALAPLLLLAACDAEVRAPGANNERVQVAADADGKVAFNLPFAKGEVKLPSGIMSNTDFDIDGVKLMPGSQITGFNVDAGQGRPGKVNFTYTAPAAPEEVRGYFLDQFRAKGLQATISDDVLQGTTKDGSSFRMRFAPQGTGTNGTIELNAQS